MQATCETLKPMLAVPRMNRELARLLKALAPFLGVIVCALVSLSAEAQTLKAEEVLRGTSSKS